MTGDIPKNIDCAELMRVRLTIIDSDWRRMNEYEIQTQIFT